MSEEDDWADVFARPGTWVGVTFVAPAWVGRLTRVGGAGFSSEIAEGLTLEAEEMGPGAAATWGFGGGYPALMTRFKAIAEALGGTVEFQTFRSQVTREERHEVKYTGPLREDF